MSDAELVAALSAAAFARTSRGDEELIAAVEKRQKDGALGPAILKAARLLSRKHQRLCFSLPTVPRLSSEIASRVSKLVVAEQDALPKVAARVARGAAKKPAAKKKRAKR